jgi:hypothetical protein
MRLLLLLTGLFIGLSVGEGHLIRVNSHTGADRQHVVPVRDDSTNCMQQGKVFRVKSLLSNPGLRRALMPLLSSNDRAGRPQAG